MESFLRGGGQFLLIYYPIYFAKSFIVPFAIDKMFSSPLIKFY